MDSEHLRLATEAARLWPEVTLPGGAFARYLSERLLAAQDDAEVALIQAHAADLYLACACVLGNELAIRKLDELYLGKLAAQLGHMRLPAATVDEVRQRLAEKLLVGNVKLSEYRGAGPLGSWIRVCAVREALNLVRSNRREVEPEAADTLMVGPDPELDFMRQRYAVAFSAAFREAVAAMPKRDIAFLRLRYVDGLNIDKIALLEGVGRSTVARWLVDARQLLLEGTIAQLNGKLGVTSDEAESLARLLRSRIDLSLHSLFKHVG